MAIKPQLACFERLGAPGWAALEEVCAAAREAGLLVVADGKRGDVPVTAEAYGQALVGETADPLGAGRRASAPTPSPPTRCSAPTPSSRWSRPPRRPGPASSPWSAPATRAPPTCRTCAAPRRPLHERLAALVDGLAERLAGADSAPLSGMGAVVGATEPAHIARLRELMPRSIFLIPGVGAQGGRPELLGAAFAPGPGGGAGPRLAEHRRRPRPGRRRRAPARRGLGRFHRLGGR